MSKADQAAALSAFLHDGETGPPHADVIDPPEEQLALPDATRQAIDAARAIALGPTGGAFVGIPRPHRGTWRGRNGSASAGHVRDSAPPAGGAPAFHRAARARMSLSSARSATALRSRSLDLGLEPMAPRWLDPSRMPSSASPRRSSGAGARPVNGVTPNERTASAADGPCDTGTSTRPGASRRSPSGLRLPPGDRFTGPAPAWGNRSPSDGLERPLQGEPAFRGQTTFPDRPRARRRGGCWPRRLCRRGWRGPACRPPRRRGAPGSCPVGTSAFAMAASADAGGTRPKPTARPPSRLTSSSLSPARRKEQARVQVALEDREDDGARGRI